MHDHIPLLLAAAALTATVSAQLPTSSTLPRGEVLLTATPQNNNSVGFGYWRTCAPRERLPVSGSGTVPTARLAYVTFAEGALGAQDLKVRRTVDGGLTWQPAVTVYTTVAGEAIDPAESRLVCSGHEVFLVFASNRHTLVAGQQAVFAIGSADQGQTWTAPLLLSTQSTTVLRDADEVNAVCSRATPGSAASLNVVFESDYNVPVSGVEDLYFAQAEIQNGALVLTVPDQRINLAVAPRASDVNFTSIAADGPVVHIGWTDNRAGGGVNQYDYFSLTSRANGTDFATASERRHTTFPAPLTWAAPRRPQVAVDRPHVYTFMEHSFQFATAAQAEDDVRMDWSADDGVTWTATDVLINTATVGNGGDIDDMFVVARDGKVAVLYVDDRLNGVNNNDNNQAIVSVSHNGGLDFQQATHVERPLGLRDPNPIYGIDMVGDTIVALYETSCVLASTIGAEDFGVSLSSDGGVTWTHHDVTRFGGCGTPASTVDVDDPRLALTGNGDVIVTWIDDRTATGTGGGNTVNNVWVTGIHYPQLVDRTGVQLGVSYTNDAPSAAGDLCIVVISITGTNPPITFGDPLGFGLNLGFDAFTDATLFIGLTSPVPGINGANVGANGGADFPSFPNPNLLFQQWFGISVPVWAAAFTLHGGTLGKFTDPIVFQ